MRRVTRVGIVGLGSIGRAVATAIDHGLEGYRLSAVTSGHHDNAAAYSRSLHQPVPVLETPDIGTVSDIVIECAPAAIFDEVARPVLEQGRDLIVLSSGALLTHWSLVELAARTGGTLRVPTGALLGLDAVQAAAQDGLRSVRMVTRKPLRSLLDAPHLQGRAGLDAITEPTRLFTGTAREAATGFPANLNVAVALSLAGLGPDRTEVEIWADPSLQRNTHRIDVDADSARFSMLIENVPSENPKTGKITALSVIALLRKLAAPLQIGT